MSSLKTFTLSLILVGAVAVAQAQIGMGDRFPELQEMHLTGATLPELKGKVVLVDFWASWCPPCKASFPAFARLQAEYADKGVVIVAVSVDEKPGAFQAFVKKWQPPFPAVHDATQALVRAVKVPAMPTSYLLGRDGRVRAIHAGFHGEASERELRKHLDAVLAERM
jgi:thiol-disulfide isomerase/thioredoxin